MKAQKSDKHGKITIREFNDLQWSLLPKGKNGWVPCEGDVSPAAVVVTNHKLDEPVKKDVPPAPEIPVVPIVKTAAEIDAEKGAVKVGEDETEDQKILRLHAAGKSNADIAREIGSHHAKVGKRIKELTA